MDLKREILKIAESDTASEVDALADGMVAYYNKIKKNIADDFTGDRILENGLDDDYAKLDALSRKLGKPVSLLVEDLDMCLKVTVDESAIRKIIKRKYG